MKPKFYLSFFTILFCCSIISAQQTTPAPMGGVNHQSILKNKLIKGIIKTVDDYDNIDGTPYLFDDFKPSILYFPDYEPLNAELRYNVAQEEMQVFFPPDGYRVLHRGVVVGIDGALYKTYSFAGEDKSAKLLGYFQILTDNYEDKELILLKKFFIEIEPGEPAAAMQAPTPPSYNEESAYFLKFADSNFAVLTENRRNDFLDQFPKEHREELKDFIKEENLKPRREEDLPIIVDYYNKTF